ncbi:MAG: hypothetical protein JWN14_4496 [Chthonomonadales bacterium]|nr:hypothetical protein [Chthonomonadales bacterium]
MCELGIKVRPDYATPGAIRFALALNALRMKIIHFCDAVIMLWEQDWKPYAGT